MSSTRRNILLNPRRRLQASHAIVGSPRRLEAEAFIRRKFAERYEATVPAFAPNLLLLEDAGRIVAAAGWRSADFEELYLERYLDFPIEQALARLAGAPVRRERVVEVGNLAADRPGGSVDVILALARHLAHFGYEWVAFTSTRELTGIFDRLGLPLLVLAPADPSRLGEQAEGWGTYYDTHPMVVSGQIKAALEMAALPGS